MNKRNGRRSVHHGGRKWLSAKAADWQEVWLRVGDVGACDWWHGSGILTNETLELAGLPIISR